MQWFIAYFALFCNGLLHILHCFAMVYCIFCIVLQWFIAYFALFCNGLLNILHCFAMVYCIFCIVLQWFVAYFALFCNGLLHILHCFAMVYCIFCIVLQWFIAYFALFCNGLLHIFHCFAMVYCIFYIAGGSWCHAKREGVEDIWCWCGKSSHCPPSFHTAWGTAECLVAILHTNTSTAPTGCNHQTNSIWGAVEDVAMALKG